MAKTRFTFADDMFRDALRDARRSQGITQIQLAKRLGVQQSYVSKIESGERSLNFVETVFVTDALGVDFVGFSREFLRRLREGHEAAKKRRGSR